ncbi:hypothetical protein [Pelolinea submarina]|uniref:Dolichyl-phosphate-mannose-protein mannosyltransferase n=1 Tax=Pelolinea submarina TaxID=913107 RepID=A0A347ZRH8_9CHLR|nr:hypothetical protein [Pelolinea submarina]REG11534.1 hypothetical protein DFR64_1424 [Pelolinea submarina]BBB47909.1 hypothetical protein Pelsub_P1137 [Pelolinea submarina]
MKNKIALKEILFSIAGLFVSCAVFFFLSSVDLPGNWIKFLSYFNWIHFLLVTTLFFLIFQLNNKAAVVVGAVLAAAVYALPLAVRLSSGLSNATVLAGFIPYKDGFYYYNGAGMLLSGQMIPTEGLQGAFRPLFPALLSSLLLLTGENLLLTLQVMVLGTGLCAYLAAVSVRRSYGPLPAAVFFALVFAFIRPMLGDTLTELPGLAFACLALALLIEAAHTKNALTAAIGGVMLVLALSIRAGAFFMLPFLILWWGWLNRTGKRFSLKKMVSFTLILMAAFVLSNMLVPRLLVAAGESTFGNFSWMLYGQAVGGAGFKYHVQALGTSDSAVVLQAALEKMRTYPLGFLIGCYKAFRDFFGNNSLGMFDLLSGEKAVGKWIFWGTCLGLLAGGLIKILRQRKQPVNLLLLAGFLGVLFSIPFLPPIDGGNRFYAGSVPFLFALLAAALPGVQFISAEKRTDILNTNMGAIAGWASAGMVFLTMLLPLAILAFRADSTSVKAQCETGLVPYEARLVEGAYVDILPDENAICGPAPDLCRARFTANGMDQANDDFYRLLAEMSRQSEDGLRLWAGIEKNSGEYYFWAMPLDLAADLRNGTTFSGCAQGVESQYQHLLLVESILQP